MDVSLGRGQIGRLIRLLGRWDRRSPANFRPLSRAFSAFWETLFSHDAVRHHASTKTGQSEASSKSAITTLKARTAMGEVRIGRSAVPNNAQAVHDTAPSIRLRVTWIAIFQGKLAIAA